MNVHQHASKFLTSQDTETKSRLIEGLKKLQNDHLSHDVKKLKGTKGRQDLYRLRIGDYRAIFAIENDIVNVLEITPRGYGYKWL
ncbi:type II toxin-antitoxin system RelE/ParE family toxin [uncultured Methanolobus sp.]|uniref:type II toxin-antitoxin system RelE family toxin n=1 Tax=uncultured Methanolobus sp. TaxID=218300 RepID=UPI002AAB3A4B|nr:type II toxin-antitoxin system RelE/ParE family toxin [uncultured Methanolobus sp.]